MDDIKKNGAPLENIVISGISGRFPNSRNMNEFRDNLYNKVDMVDDKEVRWKYTNVEVPRRMGKISDLEKFDATFFGVHFKQCHSMDPQGRVLVEHAYEALLDAGVNPKSVRGRKIGVFVGSCFAETEKTWYYEKIPKDGFGLTGCSRAMLANRISYTLGLTGPSFLVDAACSSSAFALNCAYNAIQNGDCESALVGGCNVLLHPFVTLQFSRLGVLAPDGYCRPFDNKASGYTRAESIAVIYVQKAVDAKRIYSQVLYTKTNCDGFKEEGITYPSGKVQKRLLKEFYDDINFDPSVMSYMEAHSTGTVVGDPEECSALDLIICKNRKKPLPVGSVKSNMGHSESTSVLCSIAKVILAFENNVIAPNINFKSPRESIPSLVEGRLQVVTEPQPLEGPYIGISSFGFGGANAHCLFKSNPKEKIKNGEPSDNLCRLLTWAGRTEEAINHIFEYIEKNPLDVEFIALLYSAQCESSTANVFRGYGLFSHQPGENAICLTKEIKHFTGMKRPIVWVFSGMGSQWVGMGKDLLNIPIFKSAIEKCHAVLAGRGLNLLNIITSDDPTTFDNILHSFVGIAAIQIGIVDVLRALKLDADYFIGHSVGELGCAYADGCVTAEQMILSSYSRGMASLETKTVFGSMAAVGLGYKNIRAMLPKGVEVACHNGPDSCTISGPAENVAAFVKHLTSQGVFAKEVPCSNIPYHSSYIAEMGPKLFKRLKEVINVPVKRSTKWLSSSVQKSQWESLDSQYSSAEYHTNNLLSPVLFEETSALLPKDALTIEIAPHSLLQAILKKSMTNAVHIGLTQRGNKTNDQYFISALGKVYAEGIDLALENLYPPVEFPVSRGTPMISPLIKWDHSADWYVPRFEVQRKMESAERKVKISLNDSEYDFVVGHTIDGRILFPATAYLVLVWETAAMMEGTFVFDTSVIFEDIKFLRATTLTKDSEIEFTIMIQPGTGRFEISEGTTAVVTGSIKAVADPPLLEIDVIQRPDIPVLPTKDFYKELRLRGYHYTGLFRSVVEARSDGLQGKVKWDSNWIAFLDCLLQIKILARDTRSLCLPTGIQKMKINVMEHLRMVPNIIGQTVEHILDVHVNENMNILRSGGVEIINLQANIVSRRKPPGIPVLERYQFIPNISNVKYSTVDGVRIGVQTILENVFTQKVKGVEVDTIKQHPILQHVQDALGDLPLIIPELMLLTTQDITLKGIHVEDGKLSTQTNCLFVIASEVLRNQTFLTETAKCLLEVGYVITRESSITTDEIKLPVGYAIVSCINVDEEILVLLQYTKKNTVGKEVVIHVSENDNAFEWLERVKIEAKAGKVILYAQNEKFSGIIGLVNCIRKEPERNSVVCFFIDDKSAPPFDIQNRFYKEQLRLGLGVNVFRNGKWGTYRHLQINQNIECKPSNEHCYVNALVKSDLSSLKWIQGPYNQSRPAGELVKIQYASLNFRDVMLATGKLSADVVADNRLEHECVFGFEFSGITQSGRRVMGMTVSAAMATHIEIDEVLTFDCPDSWTLAEAATVPGVYGTVYSAFFISTQIEKGKSVLIHAGSGGVGLAAIRVAFAYGLDVFTTVSTAEKKNYLLKEFPQLKEENIGNSRDTSFEMMVMERTNGKGVDYVLNSLSDEKLQASIRCLGSGGKFLEIGKFDMANDTKIGLGHFLKELSFHSILVDKLFKATKEQKKRVRVFINKDLKSGVIKPLKTNVFPASEVEQAFRLLASGKHMGKVILQVRNDEKDEYTLPISVVPRLYCSPEFTYVIPGGLGGFGMELADWLIIRGCRKIVLSSSKGISKPYQSYRIKIWESYGVKVVINTSDISTRIGSEQLIREAGKLGAVGGIFNLAVVLRDSIIDNQDPTKYVECMAPKAVATKYLDEVSRKLCPHLQYFVVFSSVSCGRGNAGQSNYGMANSVMERIIEQRYTDGLPAKAIQWGAVGEVGLVADMQEDQIDMEIGGTLQQRISSCLEEMDPLMSCPDPIVASMVVAEKRSGNTSGLDIIETVMHIMSIKDIRSISMDSSLSEIGMDSLMAVEIRQALERDFELFLSPQELRALTFRKLQEYSEARQSAGEMAKLKLASESTPTGMKLLLRNLGDEANAEKTILRLQSLDNGDIYRTCVLIVPGVEGVTGNAWYTLAEKINTPVFILQTKITSEATCVEEIVDEIYEEVERLFKPLEHFYLLGYSFGGSIALELAKRLEENKKRGQLVLMDASPSFLKKLTIEQISQNVNEELDVIYTTGVIDLLFPEENAELVKKTLVIPTFDAKIDFIVEYAKNTFSYSSDYLKSILVLIYRRIKMVINTDLDKIPKIASPIALIRPTQVSFTDIDEEYEMREKTESEFILKFIDGTHITMLDNEHLSAMINEFCPSLRDNRMFEDKFFQGSHKIIIE